MSNSPNRRNTESLFSYLVLLGGLTTIAVAAGIVLNSYSPLFFWDAWEMVFAAMRGENLLSWKWISAQHNEHRMVLPNLFFIADLTWFHGRQWFLLASIFAIQSLHLAVLSRSMRALGNLHGAVWRTGAGLAAFCLFCPSQWENLVWGFQVGFVLPPLLATLSFVALLLYCKRRMEKPGRKAWPWLAVSIASAVCCNWSVANGVLVWPILIAASWALLDIRFASIYGVVGSLSIWRYFHAFVPGVEGGGPLRALQSPLALLQYMATYLGSAWVWKDIRVAVLIGAIALLGSLAWVFRAKGYADEFALFKIQLLMLLSFCVGTAFLTGLGRMSLGLEQAFASRYQTTILLFWWAFGMLALLPLFAEAQSHTKALLAQGFLLAVFVMAGFLIRRPWHEIRYRQFAVDRAAVALLMNVNDPEVLRFVYPSSDMAWDGAQYLRKHELSIFSEKNGARFQMSKTVGGLESQAACFGSVSTVEPIAENVPGIYRVTGWVWDQRNRRPPVAVFAESGGNSAGRFALGAWLPTIRAQHHEIKSSYIGFSGYVSQPSPSDSVILYALLPGRPQWVCRFAVIDLLAPSPHAH